MDDEVRGLLDEHEKRISRLESILGKAKKQNAVANKKLTLSDHIIKLRDGGFFSQPKTAEETHKQIQQSYPCELNRVEVALIRLANKREIRKASKLISGKSYKAYVG